MKTNNRARATFSRRMVVILLTAVMALSFTACGNGETGKNAEVTTTQVTTVKGEEKRPTEIPQDVNPGQWHEDSSSVAETTTTTTTTVTTTTEPTTTTSSEAPKQEYYEYDVAGAKIKLRTHIEDYTSQNAVGNWRVDLKGIAQSLGYHPVSQSLVNFRIKKQDDTDTDIYLDKLDNQSYCRVVRDDGNGAKISFARYDISDDSINSYWIYADGNGANATNVNFQQIVIFTFLLENAKYAPSEDWIESTGIPTTSGGPDFFYVDK